MFRIYIDAKRLPYNASYDTLLYNQLEWLSLMADANLTDKTREKSMFRLTMLGNYSYYYWNDMLRKIVLGEICPRMLKLGKTTKAIQLANMAEYRLLNKINYAQDTTDPYNREYATNLFDMVDTLDVDKVVDYTAQMANSDTRINRFYKESSNTDSNYWNDIIGTKYIRDGRYKEAVKYLNKVSPQFENTLNTAEYMKFNPFSLYKEKIDKPTSYKLKFAQRMYELECLIATSKSEDNRAEYMIDYAVGLRNSHTFCWPLSYYYYGGRIATHSACIEKAISKSEQLIKKAFNTFKNPERAASAHYKFGNYKTVVENYSETSLSQATKGACDSNYDYHYESAKVYVKSQEYNLEYIVDM